MPKEVVREGGLQVVLEPGVGLRKMVVTAALCPAPSGLVSSQPLGQATGAAWQSDKPGDLGSRSSVRHSPWGPGWSLHLSSWHLLHSPCKAIL